MSRMLPFSVQKLAGAVLSQRHVIGNPAVLTSFRSLGGIPPPLCRYLPGVPLPPSWRADLPGESLQATASAVSVH